MSLILDALRRADAERGRGAVPGLHTPQAAAVLEAPQRRPRWPLVGAALVGGMVAAGGAVWWLRSPAPAPAPVATMASPAPAPALPTPRDAPAAGASANREAPAPSPMPAPEVPQTALPSPRIEPLPLRPATPVVTPAPPAPPPAPPPPAQPPVPAPTKPPPPAPAPADAPATKVPLLQELAPGVRQQLPTLAVSGASYSADPSYRMVIVNGQVLREGDAAAPGVVLESIAARQVVLRGHGHRWAVPY